MHIYSNIHDIFFVIVIRYFLGYMECLENGASPVQT